MKNMLIIPDPHASPEYDNERFSALGQYILSHKPQYIVCLGDMADMGSLSAYDKGTKGFEGRRYKKDVSSVIDAQNKLFAPIKKYNASMRKHKKKSYKPKLHMCIGNHEDRIDRATNGSPELHGTIGLSDLQYEKFGWKITPFKRSLSLEGIVISHYFTSGIAGRPISSTHVGYHLVSKLHCSAIQGHSHLYNCAEQTRPDGQKIFGLSAGCFSHPKYSESWCKDTEYLWWRGIVMLEGLDGEGYYDEMRSITQRKIIREYGSI